MKTYAIRTTTATALAVSMLATLPAIGGSAIAADSSPTMIPKGCKAKAVVQFSKTKKAVRGGAKVSCKKWQRHQIQAILFKNGKKLKHQMARGPEKGRKDCKTQNKCGVYTKAVKNRKGQQKWCTRAEFFLMGKSTIKWSCKYA
ncbi:hypothetical protein [Streptomyces sp. MZ04]|uniref:hypothetical protein n=1 Tax=Streptomyces sp. MZ04 TaxID=2559236 RepID=UPI00107E64C4|nr:hypothetical protein [Streptomyces sp. MZ04]TGA90701.1 hypothetical protein E2651_38425 [Streptomyces sp. MZ04]